MIVTNTEHLTRLDSRIEAIHERIADFNYRWDAGHPAGHIVRSALQRQSQALTRRRAGLPAPTESVNPMPVCKNCHQPIASGIAQQSTNHVATALDALQAQDGAEREDLSYGPLCDLCLEQWQANYKEITRQREVPDCNREPASG